MKIINRYTSYRSESNDVITSIPELISDIFNVLFKFKNSNLADIELMKRDKALSRYAKTIYNRVVQNLVSDKYEGLTSIVKVTKEELPYLENLLKSNENLVYIIRDNKSILKSSKLKVEIRYVKKNN